jgi:low affinity Fe/Cu permease
MKRKLKDAQATGHPVEKTSEVFRRFASAVAHWTGTPYAFILAFGFVTMWLLTGPYFHYSDTWQLVINTSTTIITFLMVFLIQSTQNRDAKALHLKLDELIRAQKLARNALIDLEDTSDEEIEKIERGFKKIKQ